MITAYFDESYNDQRANSDQPLIYTVAGYVGLDVNWKKFRKEWRRELARKGLDSFHMNQFEFALSQAIAGREIPKKNAHHGWSTEDFVPFLVRLHKTIGRRDSTGQPRLTSFQTQVIKADFDKTRPDELKDDPECRSYYMICATNLMTAVAEWAEEKSYPGPIRYVFAGNGSEDGNLGRWFTYCWKYPNIFEHFKLGVGFDPTPCGPDIRLAKTEPGLQAADIVAYEFNKTTVTWIERNYEDMPKSTLRKSLSSLVRSDYRGWTFREPELIKAFAEIAENRKKFPL